MAKVEHLERISRRERFSGAPESAWRRSIMPAISWGAVIAGVAVALSVQLVLTLFGMATGVAMPDFVGSDGSSMATLIWVGIGMLILTFVGGFVAGRISGLRRKTDGILHGAVTWAVAMLLLAALAGYTGGTPVGASFGGMGTETAREARGEDYELTVILRGLIGGDVSVADVQALERYVRSGQREEAVLLLSSLGMDPVHAATVVDRAMTASYVTRSSDTAVWLVFGGVFLSLLSGMGGGLVGALGAQRLVWNKPAAV